MINKDIEFKARLTKKYIKSKVVWLSLLLMVMFFPVSAKSSLSELEQAHEDYQQAYKYYTSLVTSSKETGNVQDALKKYRNAYARYKRLKGASRKQIPPKPTKGSNILNTMGIDGIVDIDTIIIWKQNKQGLFQLFLTDKNERTPLSISPEYKNYSAFSPINICSSNESIVYTAGKTPERNKLNIYFKKTLTSKPIRLLKNATALGFSPSCDQLLFRKNTAHKLYLYSFKTKKTKLLFKGIPINTAVWSLDGKTIAIESQKNKAKSDIFLLSNLNKSSKIKSTNITNTKNLSEKHPFFDEKGNVFFNVRKGNSYALKSVNIDSQKVKDWHINEFCMASFDNNSQFLSRPSYKPVVKLIDNKIQEEFLLDGLYALWLPKKSGSLKSGFTQIDEPDNLTRTDQKITEETIPNITKEEMKLPPIKVRQANAKLSRSSTFQVLPKDKPQQFSFADKIKVSLPPNFASKEKSLSISHVEIDKAIMVEGAVPLSLIDLTLNEGEQPLKPVEVSFKYDPDKLGSFTAEERLEAFRWDKEGGGWVKLPIRIDEKENISYAQVDHFSIIGFFTVRALIYGGAYIATVVAEKKLLNKTYFTPDKNFKILYSDSSIRKDPDLNTSEWKKAKTGRSVTNKSNAPPYVQAVGYILEEALKSYTKKFHFKNPAGKEKGYFGTYQKTITVKLDSWFTTTLASGEPSYEKVYERIHVPTNGAFQYWSAKRVFAHELFHRVQAEYYGKLGMLRGSTTKVYTGANCWWLEATAEYAAYHMAFNPSLSGMENGLGNNYLEYPINKTGLIPKTDDNYGWTEREYEYITSIWVKYLVDIRKLDLEKMIAADASDYWKPEYSLGRYMYTTHKKSSSDFYRDFTHWMMFSPKGGLNKYAYTTQVNKDDRDIAIKNSTLILSKKGELSYTFNMPEHFTSQLWAISLDKPASNNLVKKSPVIIDVKEKAIGSVIDVFLLPKGKSFINPPIPIETFHTGKQSKIILVEEGQVLSIVATQGSIPGGNTTVIIRDGTVQLDISPSEIPDAKSNKLYSFEIKATEIPEEIKKVKIEWDYSDGTKKSLSDIEVVSESAKIEIEHEYKISDKEEIYPLKVSLKDNNTGITLAVAEARITVPIKAPSVFISERHLVGPPGATFDMEALASPENTYKFVWVVEGMAEEFTQTGKKSGIAPIIDKIGEYTCTVKMYNLDNEYLATDQATINVEDEGGINLIGYYSYYDSNTKKRHIVEAHTTHTGYPPVHFFVIEGAVPTFTGEYENKDAFAEKVKGVKMANEKYKYIWKINGVKDSSAGKYREWGNELSLEVESEPRLDRGVIGIGVTTVCVEVIDEKGRFIGKDCWTVHVKEAEESKYLISPLIPDGDE